MKNPHSKKLLANVIKRLQASRNRETGEVGYSFGYGYAVLTKAGRVKGVWNEADDALLAACDNDDNAVYRLAGSDRKPRLTLVPPRPVTA